MTTSKKWLIGGIAALVIFFLLIYYSTEIYVWTMGKITTLLIWLVLFAAGWLLGRYGGRRSERRSTPRRRLSADDDD